MDTQTDKKTDRQTASNCDYSVLIRVHANVCVCVCVCVFFFFFFFFLGGGGGGLVEEDY